MRLALTLLTALFVTACDVRRDATPAPDARPSPPAAAANDASPASPAPIVQATPYRAVGTEPGWALTIADGRIDYVGDYGDTKINQPAPAPIISGSTKTYRTARLEVAITPGRCSDGMSDFIYRDAVSVRADDKRVTGCGGGTIAPDGLADTNWTVTAINGRATPSGGGYVISFTDRNLTARFGCNSIGGAWRLNGDHLSTGDLTMTEMGCGEPMQTFERLGVAVLSSNMRIERSDGNRTTLVSEAGSIELKRAI